MIRSIRKLTLSKDIQYGPGAFSGVDSIHQLYISSEIRLSESMFRDCGNLVYVCMTDSMEKYALPDYMFANCGRLSRFDWHGTWKTVPKGFFIGCSSLQLTLPAEMTEIGERAFSSCRKLGPELTVPADCLLDKEAFYGCTGIETVRYAGKATLNDGCFRSSGVTAVSMPDNASAIPAYTFEGCKALKEITIPAQIRSLGQYAFSGCGAESLELPATVLSVDKNVFSGCSELK